MTEPMTDPGAAETAALPADPAVGQVDPVEAQPVSGTDSDTAAAASATLSDAQIAAITEAVNRSEVEQGKLAKSRSKNAEVRRFATMMIQHHGAAEKKQAALKLETAESPLSQELGQEASSTIESLKSKQGADFDRAYLAAQIEGHQKVLDALDHDLRPQAQNPALQDYLAQLEPTVAQHLQSAHKAQEALDKNTSTGTAKSSSAKHQSTR
jgi:putative membrane protein